MELNQASLMRPGLLPRATHPASLWLERSVTGGLWLVALGVIGVFVWILGDLLYHGTAALSLDFMLQPPLQAGRAGGISNERKPMHATQILRREKSNCCISVTKLETRRLSVRYDGWTVLHNVSLPIHKCCATAIIGPSGCGKSSFLMALNRLTDLIPGASVTGEVLLDGDNLLADDVNVTVVRRRIGMIFQKPNPFPLSIERNLTLALEHHGVKERTVQAQVVESSLQAVGLWQEVKDKLRVSGLALSGGQQQRLCIARAIALQPEVLLMDEPCSALDPRASAQVEELIRALARRFTVVVVTHNLQQARRVSDYAALFWQEEGQGKLTEAGPTEALFDDPQQPETRAYVQGVIG